MLSPKLCAFSAFFIIATGCGPSGTGSGGAGGGHLGSGGSGGSGGGSPPGVVIGPGAPSDAPGRFGGTIDPTRAPVIVYPSDGVLLPPNLNQFEFHFQPAGDTTLFRLSFRQGGAALDIYFGCGTPINGGCVFALDRMTWMTLAQQLRGRPMADYTLAGVNGNNPGPVGVSATRTLAVADMDLTGGLYYWNAAAGSVRRYDFGLQNQTAENYLDAPRVGAMQCVGCHVLSRDGHRIAVGMDIPAPSPYKVFDVATRGMIYQQGTTFGGGANFFSFSPDAMQVLTSGGVSIAWRDAQSGAAILDPVVPLGTMPDWSPDGMHMVYAKPQTMPPCPGGFCGQPGVDSAGIEIMPFDGSQWGASTTLVPFSGQNNYYPTFSPDGGWVMFNRSPGNRNSFDAPDARVWAVAQAGGNPIQLANASTGGDSWPKWAPIVQAWQGHPLLWLTFSSRRAYGLRIASGAHAQVWMAAFDPARGAAGTDPSFPAFWLPFQEPDSGNHIAQWVLRVDRMGCTNNSMCGTNEFCVGGLCLPRPM